MARKTVGISLTEDEYDRLTKVAITKGLAPTTVAAGYVRSAIPVFDTMDEFERYIVNQELVDTPAQAKAVTALARKYLVKKANKT